MTDQGTTLQLRELVTFAFDHGELEFAKLCIAALQKQAWALERVRPVLDLDSISVEVYGHKREVLKLIRDTDTDTDATRDPSRTPRINVQTMTIRTVDHRLIRHAAHYPLFLTPGAGGHDLEQWVVESVTQPVLEQLTKLGLAADARFHSGHVVDGKQRWVYTALRPFSPGTCERGPPRYAELHRACRTSSPELLTTQRI
jgi:hypothetical protein